MLFFALYYQFIFPSLRNSDAEMLKENILQADYFDKHLEKVSVHLINIGYGEHSPYKQ